MKIRAGYDIAFQCPQPVPMLLMLTTHPSRDGNALSDQSMQFLPGVDARDHFDLYGNICTRLVSPPGLLEVRSEFIVEDSGLPDEVCPAAPQWDVAELPGDVFPFLLASRYCDTENKEQPKIKANLLNGSFNGSRNAIWAAATNTRSTHAGAC